MACITKLASAIAYDCDTGATGLVSALIINKADIVSFGMSADGQGITSLAISGANQVFKVDTVKRAATASSALKVNDGAPNAFTHSVSLTITSASEAVHSAISQAISNGSFVVLVKRANGTCQVYGLYYGLSATAYDRSTHDNGGWATVTLETPENVIGEDNLLVGSAYYDTLFSTAVG
jgi:hypothetical protein